MKCWHKVVNKGDELKEERRSFSKLPLGKMSKMWCRLSDPLQMLTHWVLLCGVEK